MFSTAVRASAWDFPGATFAMIPMARSRFRRVIETTTGFSTTFTTWFIRISSPRLFRIQIRLTSLVLSLSPETSRTRISIRRSPSVYWPTRIPPIMALIARATVALSTPCSPQASRSGPTWISGAPTT